MSKRHAQRQVGSVRRIAFSVVELSAITQFDGRVIARIREIRVCLSALGALWLVPLI
jgi:hypothetical protein